ncbi:YihA family ribosome biogenesis GTP-binding protein [Halobacillus litoralis]|uniref:Probable GTP-binding protein EngB n=1 Tax=Halobacillus litoralis TaxID=45668 RepID=A0A845DSZ1_9BACI|nr:MULTISPECIES: ribosome biogenesis GTP-binding protein YihA/YsxC [Halobacillus]MCA1021752.1 ribosome biogenesis GTP-binding protein YihA/YsxC [Halobacillus litoralis]MYL19939.1 YihA family ribosome biogenesis GTP-binding protein [Halobacillus litoralis]MYL29085.1 YihA family ribosome biogenesis GTP-binding protein [Halobacillus halophilus]MYL37336.1 YihA family ribosome biogenesis GTP-binding protein [Halobacillus litoralis]
MKVNSADIVISAASKKQYPNQPIPEIALAGRSNVGKSSFINKMIQRKNLARTSSKPGKTQTLNFYIINDKFHFVDVPGYGYAKVSKKERAKWGAMMEEYFAEREQLKATALIIDVRHKPSEDDQVMYDYLKHFDVPVMVIATKLDKIKKGQRHKQLKMIQEVLEMEEEDTLIPFSSETGEGKDKAWKTMLSHLQV